jgi:3D (Asp-Asp-Asp) domain-containing protein
MSTGFPYSQGRLLQRHAFYGLTLPQDTGAAIRSNRIDLFCGAEDEAAHIMTIPRKRKAPHIDNE